MKHHLLALTLLVAVGAHAHTPALNAMASAQARNMAQRTALSASGQAAFEENKGQVRTTAGEPAPFVQYRLTQGNASIFLLQNGIAYQFNRMHYPEGYDARMAADAGYDPAREAELDALHEQVRLETYRMDMLLEGANPSPRITTEGRSSDYTNYYTHDVLDVRTYTKVTYHDVWPGIDWVVYTTKKGLKYDFVAHPGADPARIQLRFKDHEELYVDAEGRLIHGNRMGRFTEERPVSFSGDTEVATRFVLDGDVLRFAVNGYDKSKTLTIDPDRIWGTFYGGSGDDNGHACAVDPSGNVYLAGVSTSTTGIAHNGFQNLFGGGEWGDAFLVKFNSGGTRLWSTYYGGSSTEYGRSCATDANGNVYLTGNTNSYTSIYHNGFQETPGDGFLVKFSPNGTRQWATYINGDAYSCAVDVSGNVFIAGWTMSSDNVAENGHQNTYGGSFGDAFLMKFTAEGIRLWGTYYGGDEIDHGRSCAVDSNGNVFLCGDTDSSTGMASGGHDSTFAGYMNAFLVKFDPNGVHLWSTYYGDRGGTAGKSVGVDQDGNSFLTGNTNTPTFTNAIAFNGHQNARGGEVLDADAFLVKFAPDGTRIWGTYYGGSGHDYGYSCVVDGSGDVFMAGETKSSNNIEWGGYQNSHGGNYDAFLVKFSNSGTRLWATYYGGDQFDGAGRLTFGDGIPACAVDAVGNVFLSGSTEGGPSSTFAENGHQNTFGGEHDAFLVKFESGPVGIAEQAPHTALELWPNPTNGQVSISFEPHVRPRHLTLFDAAGRVVLERPVAQEAGTLTLDLSGQENGIYVVQVLFSDGTKQVQQLVKQ